MSLVKFARSPRTDPPGSRDPPGGEEGAAETREEGAAQEGAAEEGAAEEGAQQKGPCGSLAVRASRRRAEELGPTGAARPAGRAAAATLVERFDIEPYSDFSSK